MIRERNWDTEGAAARGADAAAQVDRTPVLVSYEERERRNYWRLVASNREPQGRGTEQRHGYIAPGDNVPGATPSNVDKGGKDQSKGGKSYGKMSRVEYEGGHETPDDRSWRWGGSSSSSGQSSWSWWNPSSWSGWWGWGENR